MTMNFSDADLVRRARSDLAAAETVDQFRRAQSILLPLDLNLSIKDTATAVGMSVAWVTQARRQAKQPLPPKKLSHGGRRNSIASEQEEEAIMRQAYALTDRSVLTWKTVKWDFGEHFHYRAVPITLVHHVRKILEDRRGRAVALSTAYKFMTRVAIRVFPNGRYKDWQNKELVLKWISLA